jgi:LAS superfamily LD-carboxypeptidase LdcB
MKTILILLFILSPFFLSAQSKSVETKKEVIQKKSKDLISVEVYIKILKLKRAKTVKC